MINVGMYYNVKEGHDEEFEKIFLGAAEKLKEASAGLLNAKLYKEVGKREYLIYTEWEDIGSFKDFMQSRAFSEITTHGKEIIDGRPRHRIFTDINERD